MIIRILWCLALSLSLASCAQINTNVLATDELDGRNNNSAGSVTAQNYLIALMSDQGATGLNTAETGDAAYKQVFGAGINIMGLIPGTDLAHEYVMIGAHYDHLGSCSQASPGDVICNGATDNAAGVAAVLDIALFLSQPANRPRRSVILAFWDAEEDGLLGSAHYVANPLVALNDTVAYINFDILGANLLPSLREVSIAVGAESGGQVLIDAVDAASATQPLNVVQFSEIFGQGRSDHANLIAAGVPSVFFTDSTGPCYHTTGDDISIVDFGKLRQQIAIAYQLAAELGSAAVTPVFNAAAPLATYEDAVTLNDVIILGLSDLDRFDATQQANLQAWSATMAAIVADGEGLFDQADLGTTLGIAGQVVSLLATGECDGFLAES